ncbi:MAG: hypothetical protein AAFX79_10755 [Planctomycetota bacterium]
MTYQRANTYRRPLGGCLLVLAACLALTGCSIGPDRIRLATDGPSRDDSQRQTLEYAPALLAYRHGDESSAELFATDFGIAQLDPATPLDEITGQITRVRMFTRPIRGRTPQSSRAANAVVQHVVVNRGSIAVYGGAGLFRPRGRPGRDPLPGTLDAGTVRLTRASDAVQDRLGTARIDLAMTAPLDEGLARLMAARLEQILETTTPIDLDLQEDGNAAGPG